MNFIPDPQKAMAEMIRVTRPGGTVAAAVWDYGGEMQMLRVLWDEAVQLDPKADAKDQRHAPLCKKGELAELWRKSGLVNVEEQGLTVQRQYASFAEYWQPFLNGERPGAAYVTSLSPEDRARLEQRLRQRLLTDCKDQPFTLHARVWAVKGTVPPHLASGTTPIVPRLATAAGRRATEKAVATAPAFPELGCAHSSE